ncbi:MAG: hypothetical protein ACQESR_12640 [Planctomycetota bacterium]
MESCSTQAVLPWVGLAADTIIRDRYILYLRGSRCQFYGRRIDGWGRGSHFPPNGYRARRGLSGYPSAALDRRKVPCA